MPKFNFNLRRPKSSIATPIHLVIRYNNNRVVFATKESILPKDWEKEKQRHKQISIPKGKKITDLSKDYQNKYKVIDQFNARLIDIKTRAENLFNDYKTKHNQTEPTTDQLKELLKVEFNRIREPETLDLFSFIDKFIQEAKSRLISQGNTQKTTIVNAYNQTKDMLKDFSNSNNVKIDFDTISLDLYYDLIQYMETEKKYSYNNIGKHIKNIKTFMNASLERKLHSNTAHRSKKFKTLSRDTDSIYLTSTEIEEMYKLDLTEHLHLDRVRDLFIVGCWTGLRFSDFTRIKPENIKGSYIEITPQKTMTPIVIPIHPMVKQIMDKYEGKYPNNLPPAISNVKMNLYIKDIAEMIDSLKKTVQITKVKGGKQFMQSIEKYKVVVTHTARRSFATNLYFDFEETDTLSIMAITGHKTERAFMKYIKVTPKQHAERIKKIWEKKRYHLKIS